MTGILVRMEDVVHTLKSIADDIEQIYADTPDILSLEIELPNQGQPSHTDNDVDSTTMVTLQVYDSELDSDSNSLASCSTSLNPSPASSGFTSPATSPTASGFLIEKDESVSPEPEEHLQTTPTTESNTQLSAIISSPSESRLEDVDSSPLKPSAALFPSSPAVIPTPKPSVNSSRESESPSNLSEPQLSAQCAPSHKQSSSSTTYRAPHFANAQFIQKSKSSPPSTVAHMPGISPPHLTASPPKLPSRPTAINTSTNDPPPHISALRSPTFPSIPNFEQLQRWVNQGQRGEAEEREASATYLVRQRQRARVTIVGAASLTEPRDLPVYRPQAHHLCPYPYPPRSRISVYSRRVNVGPRVLGKGLWEPWRKGGVIEQDEVAKRRRRMRMWEDALQQEQILEAAKEAESMLENGDTEHGATHATNGEIDGEDKTCNTGFQALENDEVMRAAQGTAIVEQGILDAKQTRAEDEALLFAALAALFDSKACSDPEHTTEGTDTKGPPSDKATERDLDSMEVYIKDGVLVAPPNDQPASDSGTISKDAIPPLAQVSTESIAVTKLDDHLKYAPHTRSPLSQSFTPPPPIAPIYIPSARSEAEVSSAGKMWRRFTSMMF